MSGKEKKIASHLQLPVPSGTSSKYQGNTLCVLPKTRLTWLIHDSRMWIESSSRWFAITDRKPSQIVNTVFIFSHSFRKGLELPMEHKLLVSHGIKIFFPSAIKFSFSTFLWMFLGSFVGAACAQQHCKLYQQPIPQRPDFFFTFFIGFRYSLRSKPSSVGFSTQWAPPRSLMLLPRSVMSSQVWET